MSFLQGCVGYELSDALRREMFYLNLTSEHQTVQRPVETAQKPLSHTQKHRQQGGRHVQTTTHTYRMNRCELVIGHESHVKHNEWMLGDLCSCLKLQTSALLSTK